MDLSNPLRPLLGENAARMVARLAVLGDEVTGRRAAELSGVAVASASRVLADLVDVGLVRVRNLGSSRAYSLNRAHVLWQPLEDLLAAPTRVEQRIADIVAGSAGGDTVVALYGSFARGRAGSESDIDVVVLWSDEVGEEVRVDVLDQLHSAIPSMTGNSIDIVDIGYVDLAHMVVNHDPLIESWLQDSRSISKHDLRSEIRRAMAA